MDYQTHLLIVAMEAGEFIQACSKVIDIMVVNKK